MKIRKALSFDDVLLVDKYSIISSRKDVDTSIKLLGYTFNTALISSNMATVTNDRMAQAVHQVGGLGALHRFIDVATNVAMFKNSPKETIVSCGVGTSEIERAIACYESGASRILVDVAQGANSNVVDTVKKIREVVKNNAAIIVGNFSNASALNTFLHKLPCHVDAIKIGIGGGSACITRKITGCGMPTFASILDCSAVGIPIIADGGIRNSGDFCKAIAAGASAVMCGRLFAACDESPANTKSEHWKSDMPGENRVTHKLYSGSASNASYEAQGKVATHRVAEGESYWIKATGPVSTLMQTFNAGLRSSMAYNNALTIEDYQDNAEFIEITNAGIIESGPHGWS